MNIDFATCERQRALEFIQQVYPNKEITDTQDSAGDLLDFVEKDIVRIQDPSMYGSKIQVMPGTHWDQKHHDAVVAACQQFHGREK